MRDKNQETDSRKECQYLSIKSFRQDLLLINIPVLNLRDSKFSLQDCQHMLKLFPGAGTAVTSLQSNKTVVGWRKALNLDLISDKWN